MKRITGDSRKKLIVLALAVSTVIAPAGPLFAEFIPERSAYEMGPVGRPIDDLKEFAKPNQMMSILPNRPIAARDKNGNRVYYTAGGKLAMKIGTDGSMRTSLSGKSIERDADGNLLRTTEIVKGTNRAVVRNDKEQVIGYQDLAYGGQIVKEYDYQGNQTRTYNYDAYGKNTQFVLNELNMTRTVYGKSGSPAYDLNYEGTQIATYHYDNQNRLTHKKDINGNMTFFDKNGNMTLTRDMNGNTLATYNYKKDTEGRWVLDTSLSLKVTDEKGNRTETVTYYKNGKPQTEKTKAGEIIKDYIYDGQTLRYTFDHGTNEIEWYDLNGKTTFATCDDKLAREYVYSKGALVALLDHSTGKTNLYVHEQKVLGAAIVGEDGQPVKLAAATYQKMIDLKIVKKNYTDKKGNDEIHSVELDGNSFVMEINVDTGDTAKKQLFHNGASLGTYSWDDANRTMTLELGSRSVIKKMEKEPALLEVIQGIRNGHYDK